MDRDFLGAAPGGAEESGSRIGSELRSARERLGWEIDAVAVSLRLKPAYIRAIEQGDIRTLPGTAYAVGFVRTYAQALGLDSNEAIRRFRAEREEVNRQTELDFPAPVPTRGVPAGAIVLVGAIIAIGGYAAWYHYSGRSDRSAEAVTALPAHLEPLAPPPAPKVASVTPAAQPDATNTAASGTTATPAPKVASLLPPEPDVSPSSAAAAVPLPQASAPAAQGDGTTTAAGTEANQLAAVAPPPAAASGNGAVAPTEAVDKVGPGAPAPMVIQATADAWIEIKNAQGRVLYQAVLHPGDKYTVPDQPQLTLTTGNASGTEVVLSGNVIGPLKGHVLRNIPLDPGSLKAASGIMPNESATGTTTGTAAGTSPAGTAPAAQ
jgi:cytoskeleton protein RodZ